MTESEIQREILLEAPKQGCVLMRNNVGILRDAVGNYIKYGVGGNGGSDLIGWKKIDKQAIFLAVEVKLPGKHPTENQQSFIDAVNRSGGIAGVCHSVEEFRELVCGF